MKKAAIISIYNRLEQVNLFIEQLLADGTTDVFIHVDKKCESLKTEIKKDEKVHISDESISVEKGNTSYNPSSLCCVK